MRVESNSTHVFPHQAGRFLSLPANRPQCKRGQKGAPTSHRHPGPIRSPGSSGQLERLMRSGLRHCESFAVIDAHAAGEIQPVAIRRIGPDLVFARLWKESGIPEVLRSVLKARQYEFDVERAIYLTVLHRLFASGSDRAAERWREDYLIPGTEGLELHHLYRAMAFLGDAIEQLEKPTGAVRCNKDLIEEALFERRRDLFTEVELVFFDTTSLYFEGRGGESIGQRGHTKDHRPDLKQMIVGMALDVEGRPICCEMWPGNTADVTTLLPVVKRMRERFRIREITIVADRGMVSQATLDAFENSDRRCATSLECGCAARRKLVCRCSAAEHAGLRVFQSAAKPKIQPRSKSKKFG